MAWDRYKEVKRQTNQAIRSARNHHINSILSKSLEENNSKPFWKFVKSRKQDNVGVSPLLDNGTLFHKSQDKAEILNKQFCSVFTTEDPSNIPHLHGPNYPSISGLTVNEKGVKKLLRDLKVHKASGPDEISCRLLQELHTELAPVLTSFFSQSISTGTIPKEWKKAFITPIFKKGRTNQAVNYRPVSLTCVCSKILEHIICKHLIQHMEHHGIITPRQHGFLSKHSCESQLIITLNDLTKSWDAGLQTDVAVLDLSKAFDMVPHRALLGKLEHYGVVGNLHSWISDFLSERSQSVVVDGASSSWESVRSGVPQGTVLGPILFLVHINDLPSVITSEVRLFADDCLVYRNIKDEQDQIQLQLDLDALSAWSKTWGMKYNPAKCNILSISRKRNKLQYDYSLEGQTLAYVDQAKYLGIQLSNDLKWATHVQEITSKASRTLGFFV